MIFNWLQGAIVALVIGGISFGLHSVDMSFVQKKHVAELTAQKAALEARCEAEKKITEDTANELQNKIDALTSRLATVKRMHPATCIPILADAARVDDATTKDAGLPRQDAKPHGVSSDALFDYAADAEAVGLRLDACQSFVRKTWTLANGKGH